MTSITHSHQQVGHPEKKPTKKCELNCCMDPQASTGYSIQQLQHSSHQHKELFPKWITF
jgi:hypothetical protein